ncbi:unnamed protein product [Mytilus coruscus]|uniref:Uncharacterized protein n=1 Tax=Mytilus coruscus TaxID=42192 RepID=A0A6J8BMX3_MYTCO|nr:unnamed protein product [Mytilus coruscus]
MIGKPATDLLIDEVWSSLEPVDEKITKDDTTSNLSQMCPCQQEIKQGPVDIATGLEEDISYICGMDFFPDDHPLQKICCVLAGIHCATEVSAHFYSSRLKFRPVCYVCGIDSSLKDISVEERSSYQSVHPVCTNCFNSGHLSRKRGEKKAKTRKH